MACSSTKANKSSERDHVAPQPKNNANTKQVDAVAVQRVWECQSSRRTENDDQAIESLHLLDNLNARKSSTLERWFSGTGPWNHHDASINACNQTNEPAHLSTKIEVIELILETLGTALTSE
jgi:hypothetical protein